MENSSDINKRIAKNTIYMYGRMLFVVLMGLYTSRILLDSLGITDYGISNVVGGVLGIFSILGSSMTASIQRFLNYEMGHGDDQKLNDIFCNSIIVQVFIAILVFLLFESIGLWLLCDKLVIPHNRFWAAMVLYQVSAFGVIWGILINPYNALLIAHEKMSVFAYLSVLQAFYAFVSALLLYIIPYDRLCVFSVLNLISVFVFTPIYLSYCKKNFKESKFRWKINKQLFWEMFKFSSYSFIGTISEILRIQGVTILINMFFGPIVNAAQGVATQVQNAVYKFVSNFLVSVKPQIVISYGKGDLGYMHFLLLTSTKLGYMLTLLAAFPIVFEIDYILSVWLVEAPPFTASFVRWMIIYFVIVAFSDCMGVAIGATGDIKSYQLIVSAIMILPLPVSLALFWYGFSPEWVYIVMDIFVLIRVIIQLFIICPKINLNISFFIKSVVYRCILMTLLVIPIPLFIIYNTESGFSRLIINTIICIGMILLLSYFIVLNKQEKRFCVQIVSKIRGRIK